jgi:hypothetical protein
MGHVGPVVIVGPSPARGKVLDLVERFQLSRSQNSVESGYWPLSTLIGHIAFLFASTAMRLEASFT